MEAAGEAIRYLTRKNDISGLQQLESLADIICQKRTICEAAEVESLCIANTAASRKRVEIQPYETIQQYLKAFPQSKSIRMSYISVSNAFYAQSADYRKIPDAVMRRAKEWAELYPEDISKFNGCFVTNSLLGMMPAASFGERKFDTAKVLHFIEQIL